MGGGEVAMQFMLSEWTPRVEVLGHLAIYVRARLIGAISRISVTR